LNAGLKALEVSSDGITKTKNSTLGFVPGLSSICEQSEEIIEKRRITNLVRTMRTIWISMKLISKNNVTAMRKMYLRRPCTSQRTIPLKYEQSM
jgi:hypothetical protein